MPLALFDLDETLIAGDCEDLWTKHLVKIGLRPENDLEILVRFYEDYNNGCLDFAKYQQFFLKPLSENGPQTLEKHLQAFIKENIQPTIRPSLQKRMAWHQQQGDTIVIITAAGAFLAEPIAAEMGIDNLLCTVPERVNGVYTGNIQTSCFREEKITVLKAWCEQKGHDMDGCWMYSDSRNDLPLLKLSVHPVAVFPDDELRNTAINLNWMIIDSET